MQAVQRRVGAVVRAQHSTRVACVPRVTGLTANPPHSSGGTIPGTDQAWNGHGRPSCCAAGNACRYVNTNYYQCQPNA